MAESIKRRGARRSRKGWARYDAQEPGGTPTPEIKRPPDIDVFDVDTPEDPSAGPPLPPFTGEDVEQPERDLPTT
jgi:hypothetical protein